MKRGASDRGERRVGQIDGESGDGAISTIGNKKATTRAGLCGGDRLKRKRTATCASTASLVNVDDLKGIDANLERCGGIPLVELVVVGVDKLLSVQGGSAEQNTCNHTCQ